MEYIIGFYTALKPVVSTHVIGIDKNHSRLSVGVRFLAYDVIVIKHPVLTALNKYSLFAA